MHYLLIYLSYIIIFKSYYLLALTRIGNALIEQERKLLSAKKENKTLLNGTQVNGNSEKIEDIEKLSNGLADSANEIDNNLILSNIQNGIEKIPFQTFQI